PVAYMVPKAETTPEEKPTGPGSVIYTCPMHQEIRQSGPGACSKCGMALEPLVPIPAAAQTEYVCPMHPEIVRSVPGACPICGMALEPRTVTLADEVNPELVDMTRRCWVHPPLSPPPPPLALSVSL